MIKGRLSGKVKKGTTVLFLCLFLGTTPQISNAFSFESRTNLWTILDAPISLSAAAFDSGTNIFGGIVCGFKIIFDIDNNCADSPEVVREENYPPNLVIEEKGEAEKTFSTTTATTTKPTQVVNEYITNEYYTNPTTVVREVVKEVVVERNGGGGSSNVDTGNFVSKEQFEAQVNATHDSIENTSDGISTDIATAVSTGSLIVSGNTTLKGTVYDSNISAGSNGYILQTTGSGTAWVATSTLGIGGVGSVGSVSSSTLAAGNWANGYILQASTTASSGFDWVATSTLGISGGGSSSLTDGYILVGDNSGNSQATSSIYISDSGYVGIGTTSPLSKLHIDNGTIYTSISGGASANTVSIVGGVKDDTNLDNAHSVAVSGRYAYVANATDDSLRIIDVSDPTNPTIVGGIKDSTNLDRAWAVSVSGRYAYVVSLSDKSLRIIDVSDPTAPYIVGGIKDGTDLNGVNSVYISGRYAYVTAGNNNSLRIIDVSDPTAPYIVGGVQDGTDLQLASSVYVSGRYAYVTTEGDDSLRIIDISDPTNPSIVGGVKDVTNLNTSESVFVSGRYAYVTSLISDSLQIIDVSDPTAPYIVGGVTDATNLDGALRLFVSGRYAYVTNVYDDSLRIIDVSDPTAPYIVGGIKDGTDLDNPQSIFVSGRYAYITAYNDNSLRIIDLGGLDTHTASVGNLEANFLNVSTNAQVGNAFSVGSSLNVGTDALIGGALTIAGTASSTLLSSNTNPALVITTGNVGIGTTSPSTFKLEVAGNIGPESDDTYTLGGSGRDWECIYYSGGTSGTCSSDKRLKTNIETLSFSSASSTALDKLSLLEMKSFEFKTAPGSVYHGFIAQEVLEVAPELVTKGSNGYWAVKYGDIQWLMFQAIQELYQKVLSLTEQITKLAEQIISKEIIVENRLCIGATCINETDLQAMLTNSDVEGTVYTREAESEETTASTTQEATNSEEEDGAEENETPTPDRVDDSNTATSSDSVTENDNTSTEDNSLGESDELVEDSETEELEEDVEDEGNNPETEEDAAALLEQEVGDDSVEESNNTE